MFTIFRNWWLIALAFAAVCHGQNTYGGSATGPKDVEIPIPLVPSGSYQQKEHPRDIVLTPTTLRPSGNGGYGGSASGIVVPSDVPNTYGGAIAIDFNCVDLANGNYPDPKDRCNTFYYVCSAYRASKVDCPKDLYYDPDNDVCEKKLHVPACGGSKPTTIAIPADVPTLSPSIFDCTENEDGYYPNPLDKCSPIYYSCTGGRAKELHCQEGLVFDPDTNACELKYTTYVCTGTRSTKAPATYGGIVTTPNYPMDCKGKEDGFYPDPTKQCSNTFYVCTTEKISMSTCAGNTFFDIKTQRCDTWMNVFACSGMERQNDDLATYQSAVKPVDFDCSSLPSGSYPDPKLKCANHYYVCTNGIAHEMNCPATLYWDPDELSCKSFDDIFACTGTTKAPTTTTEFIPSDAPIPEYDCSDKVDGFYLDPSNKCSSIYFVCSNHHDYKIKCPTGLYFDLESTLCLSWSHVFDCSGKRMEPTYPTMTTTVVAEIIPIDCQGKEDGDYPDPENKCSHIYYSCSGGKGSKRHCATATATYFDFELGLCDIFDNVPMCSGHDRPITTTLPPHDIPVEVFPFDCTKLRNGLYSAGDCESYYWSCVGGVTHKTECPFGLKYDIEMNTCDLKVYIPKCGGQRTTPLMSYGTTEATNWPVNCHQLPDGAYPDPAIVCDHSYYVCVSGRTYKLLCPTDLYFDVDRNRCDIKKRILACGGSIAASSAWFNAGVVSNDLPQQFGGYERKIVGGDVPAAAGYQQRTTLINDVPAAGYQQRTTLKIDVPAAGYQRRTTINDVPADGYQQRTTMVNDVPAAGYQQRTTLKIDVPADGYQQRTTLINDVPAAGYQQRTTMVNDVPTDGYQQRTTINDVPADGYQQRTTMINDVPAAGYQQRTTLINDVPTDGYQQRTTLKIDVPADGYQQRTTLINDVPAAGYQQRTTVVNDVPTDGYQQRTTFINDVPTDGYQQRTTMVNDVPTEGYQQRTTLINDVPAAGYQQRTTLINDVPTDGYQQRTTLVNDIPAADYKQPLPSANGYQQQQQNDDAIKKRAWFNSPTSMVTKAPEWFNYQQQLVPSDIPSPPTKVQWFVNQQGGKVGDTYNKPL